MPVITIGAKEFIQGESQSDLIADKGFSPISYGINPLKTRGALHFIETPTDRGSTTLTGNIVASGYDKNYLGNDGYFVDDEGAFYTISGATFTKRQTIVADTFALGTTDLVQFLGVTYATGQSTIQALTGGDLTGVTDSFWSGLTSTVRHPLERVEDGLYVGNGNIIGKITSVSSTTAAWLTLPTDVNVTSLRKHPDGKTLIAFCGLTTNLAHVSGNGGRIYLVDINTASWTREIETETQIEGSRSAGGVVYVTYGPNVGYFNGNGITFLKKLTTNTYTYSNLMGLFEDAPVIADGREAIMFKDVGGGKSWFRIYKNTTNTNNLGSVLYKGDNKMLFAAGTTGTGILEEVDYDNSGTNGQLITNRYWFGGRAEIDKIALTHDLSDTAGTTRINLHQRNMEGSVNSSNQGGSGQIADVTYSSQNVVETEVGCDIKTSNLQLYLVNINDDIGYKEIRIYYAPIE